MDAAHQFTQFGECFLGVGARVGDEVAGVAARRQAFFGSAQRHGDGDQPCLRAVVQVALDPAEGGGRIVDRGPTARL